MKLLFKVLIVVLFFVGFGYLAVPSFAQTFLPNETFIPRPNFARQDLSSNQFAPIDSQRIFRVPVLMYHYVENVTDTKDTVRKSLNTPPYIFESQVKTLKDDGYTFLTVSELGAIIDRSKIMPKKPIAITIDDGHWDLATDILPILRKYNVRVTAYIITGLIGNSDFMTRDQLKYVINSNFIEIGAHTVTHESLSGLPETMVSYEVGQSKKDLESEYGIKSTSFAYPNGSFDENILVAVRDAGFNTAVSTIPGVYQSDPDRYTIYRIRPGYKTGRELLDFLSQNSFEEWPQK